MNPKQQQTIESEPKTAGEGYSNANWKTAPAYPVNKEKTAPASTGSEPRPIPKAPEPTATVAASAEPTATPASAPAIETPAPTITAAPAAPPEGGQVPLSSAPVTEAPKSPTVTIEDPNTVIEHNGVKKTIRQINWEEGIRDKYSKRSLDLNEREKEVRKDREVIESDPDLARIAALVRNGFTPTQAKEMVFHAPQSQTPQTVITDDDQPPPGTTDGDPAYEVWKARKIGKATSAAITESLKPLVERLNAADQRETENSERKREADETFRHNIAMFDVELPKYIPAMAGLDEAEKAEIMSRIAFAAQAEGYDIRSRDGVARIAKKLATNDIRIIALDAFSDGWVPGKKTAAPTIQPSKQQEELKNTLEQGKPLVPPALPEPLLPSVAPSGSPAGNTPSSGRSDRDPDEIGWKERLQTKERRFK